MTALAAMAVSVTLSACRARTPTPARSPAPLALWFVGDAHAGRSLSELLRGDPALAQALSRSVGFANLEGPVVERAEEVSERRLLNESHTLGALVRAGVRFVSVTNNHAMDEGAEGRARTAALVRRAGLAPLGEGVTYATVEGRSIAWIARDLSGDSATALRALREDLAQSRGRASLRVLSLHVSAPPLYTPPPAVLRAAVDDAVAAGVSILVAHGTHTVAPIERRGATVIAWGLGNAVFSCRCSRETEGLLLRVTVTGEGEVRAGFVPLEAGMDGAAATVLGPEGASFELMRALGVRSRREGATGWL